MEQAVVTLVIAALSGLGVMNARLHNRISHLDRRTDQIELRVAENYVAKSDFNEILSRVESHMVRIENKLDKIIFK